MVEKTKKNLLLCRCKFCPSYSLNCRVKALPKIAKSFLESSRALKAELNVENLFCAFGQSGCINQKHGCLCPKCPVYKQAGLTSAYYCQSKA